MEKEIAKGLLEDLILKDWDKKKEIEPLVFMSTPEGIVFMMVRDLMKDAPEKRELSDIIYAMVRLRKADLCALVTEAWMATFTGSKFDKKVEEALDKYGQVSKMPERIESVMLLIWTKTSTNMKMWAIDRTQEPNKLVPWEDFNTSSTEDRNAIFANPFVDR